MTDLIQFKTSSQSFPSLCSEKEWQIPPLRWILRDYTTSGWIVPFLLVLEIANEAKQTPSNSRKEHVKGIYQALTGHPKPRASLGTKIPQFHSNLIDLFIAFVHAWVHECMCRYMCRGRPKANLRCPSPRCYPLCFLRQIILLAWSSSSRLGSLVREPQDSACLRLLQTGITGTHHHTWIFLMWVLWIEVFMNTRQIFKKKISYLPSLFYFCERPLLPRLVLNLWTQVALPSQPPRPLGL